MTRNYKYITNVPLHVVRKLQSYSDTSCITTKSRLNEVKHPQFITSICSTLLYISLAWFIPHIEKKEMLQVRLVQSFISRYFFFCSDVVYFVCPWSRLFDIQTHIYQSNRKQVFICTRLTYINKDSCTQSALFLVIYSNQIIGFQ